MKAYSCGLEVEIKLTDEEITELENNPLEGILNFREVLKSDTREIPFSLRCDTGQGDFIKVKIIPKKTYFGDANKIDFCINKEYHQELLTYGSMIERFYISGKLRIKSEKIKYSENFF